MLARMHRDTGGASAVEFALLLPVLIMLLFGTMYGASLFNTQQTVTQAAREGARYGATLPLSATGGGEPPPNPAWREAVEDRAMAILDVDRALTPGEPSVCVRFYEEDGSTTDNGAAACSASSASSAGVAEGLRVEVITLRPARLELGVASIGPIDLTGAAVARFEAAVEDG